MKKASTRVIEPIVDLLPLLTGIAVFLIALAVLIGWWAGLPRITSVFSGYPTMKPNTAMCLGLLGAGMAVHAFKPLALFPTRLSIFLVSIALLFSGAILVQWTFSIDLRIDQLIAFDPGKAPVAPGQPQGRPSPATATGLSLLSISFFFVRVKPAFAFFQACSIIGGLVGWLGLLGNLYNTRPIFGFTSQAIHTSFCLVILSIALLCLRKDRGFIAILLADSTGGKLARRMALVIIALPILLGYFRIVSVRNGWIVDQDSNASLFIVSIILGFIAIVSVNARWIHNYDLALKKTIHDLAFSRKRLESQMQRMNLLDRVTRAIAQRIDLPSIYHIALDSLQKNFTLPLGVVLHLDNNRLVVQKSIVDESIAGRLALNDGAVVDLESNGLSRCAQGQFVHETDALRIQHPFIQRLAGVGLRSVIFSPLAFENRVIGVLLIARRDPNAFSSGECEFTRQLSEHVALASHNAQLYSDLHKAYDMIQVNHQTTLQQEKLRALGEMAGGIAHDVNNSLTPVALYVDALLEHAASSRNFSDEENLQYLKIIQRGIHDVARTISRMREFSRPHSQEPVANLQINDIVQHALSLTRSRWHNIPAQKGINIEIISDLSSKNPIVQGYENEITDALINLIHNAVDAMAQGGRLTLKTRVEERGVLVEVADTGCGMDERTRQRCLEPFFTTKGDSGSGLGLAMVWGMAGRHEARLEINSAPGKGTSVALIFPPPKPLPEAPATQPPSLPPRPLHILVIDDDPVLGKAIRETLLFDNHRVDLAESGPDGLRIFDDLAKVANPVDIVISDLGMPQMDGRQVAAVIKNHSPNTPVILLTGYGQGLDDEPDPNISLVLSKPPRLTDLRTALAKCTASNI